MVSKTIFMLLGAVLLLKAFEARYLDSNTHDVTFKDEESALRALVGRLQLQKFAQDEHAVIERDLINKHKPVMEKVLNDPKVLEVKSERMKEIINEIQKFLKKDEEFLKTGIIEKEPNKLMDLHDMIVDQYADEKTARDEPEAKILVNSFKENGFERFGKSIEAQEKVFHDKFTDEVQKYVDGLTESEKQQDPKIVKLLEELKGETELEKRDMIVWMFLGMITLDDFLW